MRWCAKGCGADLEYAPADVTVCRGCRMAAVNFGFEESPKQGFLLGADLIARADKAIGIVSATLDPMGVPPILMINPPRPRSPKPGDKIKFIGTAPFRWSLGKAFYPGDVVEVVSAGVHPKTGGANDTLRIRDGSGREFYENGRWITPTGKMCIEFFEHLDGAPIQPWWPRRPKVGDLVCIPGLTGAREVEGVGQPFPEAIVVAGGQGPIHGGYFFSAMAQGQKITFDDGVEVEKWW